jgi:hypothetical protein
VTSDIDTYQPAAPTAPQPTTIGQATAVEQARAVAEVQAAIIVAQQCPRNISQAVQQMRESCAQKGLADRAFFRFLRAGSTVSGPSVHLARELARCWGNVQYGITELSRDDTKGESQMLAFAWDVQTNTRATTTFIVKHGRDTKKGRQNLTDLRDIYENNANNGARRLREQIFAILPKWFTEEAEDLCAQTIAHGGGKPLATRVADAIRKFEEKGVTSDRLEQKVGRPSGKWTDHDVAQLGVTYKSIERGEISLDDEFPPQRITAAEITGSARQNRTSAPVEPAEELFDVDPDTGERIPMGAVR